MSALQNRDSNAQRTANPFESEKQVAAGAENKLEEGGLHKQLLDQKNGYVQPAETTIPSCPLLDVRHVMRHS